LSDAATSDSDRRARVPRHHQRMRVSLCGPAIVCPCGAGRKLSA
jgi:hypothetical protein